MRAIICSIVALSALALSPGCSTGPPTGTVTGEVTFDGQPLKEGRIAFLPVDGQSPTAGTTIRDGKFETQVPVTKMRVEINANKVIGKRKAYDTPQSPVVDEVVELIPARYNTESELTLDVKRGSQKEDYHLKSK